MSVRHPNRPNAYKPPKRSFKHRCQCKPNKVGADNRFTAKERQVRRIA